MTVKTRKRPEGKNLQEAMEGKTTSAVIDKHFTAMKVADDGESYAGGLFVPDDDQLTRINQFTRSPKTADEVICFTTMSCNDLLDRDLDRFTTECVKDFSKLEGNLSPIGKSYMVGHDYNKLPVGRIFGADTKSVDGATFLTNEVYIPNTAANKDFIENVDFGVYWAVSVGVMLSASACTVCDKEFSGWGYWCVDGHEKGLYYDPNSTETDSWGWPEPVEPSTKGAVFCYRDLSVPTDFYELSQVFLGAQYFAELDKNDASGSFKTIKSFASKMPVVNLSAREAKQLPLPKEDERVAEARQKYTVNYTTTGAQTWTDNANMVWVYNNDSNSTEGPEVLCLGLSKESEDKDNGEELWEQNVEGGGQEESDDGTAQGSDETVGDQRDDGDGTVGSEFSEGVKDSQLGSVPQPVEREPSMSKAQIATAAKKAGVSSDILEEAEKKETSEEMLEAIFMTTKKTQKDFETKISELEPRAELGDQFLKNKREEAISWYVKNKQAGEEKGINVDKFTRMLDRFGDDVELLDEVIQEQKEMAQAKFPAGARRSVALDDPNEPREALDAPLDEKEAKRVRSIHG